MSCSFEVSAFFPFSHLSSEEARCQRIPFQCWVRGRYIQPAVAVEAAASTVFVHCLHQTSGSAETETAHHVRDRTVREYR